MSVVSEAVLTQILTQLQNLQVSQQVLQAKVRIKSPYNDANPIDNAMILALSLIP